MLISGCHNEEGLLLVDLVGRDQGNTKHPPKHKMASSSQQRIIWPQILVVSRMRNHAREKGLKVNNSRHQTDTKGTSQAVGR